MISSPYEYFVFFLGMLVGILIGIKVNKVRYNKRLKTLMDLDSLGSYIEEQKGGDKRE